jgi:hypothetical protein
MVQDVEYGRVTHLIRTPARWSGPRFGYDLSEVRVQRDAPAAASADVISASAYTFGLDIFLLRAHFSRNPPWSAPAGS